METTTDLTVVKTNPKRFVWGEILKIHTIGRYDFIEYVSKHAGSSVQEILFHVYVDSQDIRHSCHSLEGAMILAVSHGSLSEPNLANHMAQAAVKLLDVGV